MSRTLPSDAKPIDPAQTATLEHEPALGAGGERDAADRELYARIVERRHDAFAELYERYFPELYDFAARITRDRTTAADIVQSVFARVWEQAGRGAEVRAPRAWLYRLTHNAAIDEVRRRSRTGVGEASESFDFSAVADPHADEPTQVLIDKELAELVWSTAAKMRPDEYGLLDLYVRRDLPPDELAEQLGITPGALYTRLSRLRRSFEDALTVTLLARRGGRDCEAFGALVAELGAEIESERGSRVLRNHVRECPDCRHARSRYVTASQILAGLAPVPLTPGVQDAIWSSLSALLGFGASGAAVAAGAAHGVAHGPVRGHLSSIIGTARANPVASAAAVAAAVAVGVGSWAAVSALGPQSSEGVARDPARFWSPAPGTVRTSDENRIAISWTRLSDAAGYSILWSHGPKDEPDAVADLPGTATRTMSPPLPVGRWYFHLRTHGPHGWTHTVHLGPFVIVPARAGHSPREGPSSPREGPSHDTAPTTASRQGAPPRGESAAPAANGGPPPTPSPPPTSPRPSDEPAAPAVLDRVPPFGQTVALAGGPYYRRPSVPLVLTAGSDRGSGVDPSSGIVERSAGLLARGSCNAWSPWAPVTLRSSADAAVADGHCYRYRYRISDLAGNRSVVSPPSAAAIVDTAPPTPPTLTITASRPDAVAVGTAVFYRPTGHGGTFTVVATATDDGSGLAAIEFPGLSAGVALPAPTRRTAAPYEAVYAWSSGAVEAGLERVTAFDRAGNSAAAVFTLAPDALGPQGLSVALAGGTWRTDASVPLEITQGVDTGSGIAAGSFVVERESAPLRSGDCGDFTGAWTTVALDDHTDTTARDGACSRYRVSAADEVGNITTSPPSEPVRIDTTPPSTPVLTLHESSASAHVSGATLFYRPAAGGSFSIAATSDDPESGIDRVSFPTLRGATGGGDDRGVRHEAGYDWSTLAATGPQTVTATNRAGQSTTATFTLAADTAPPTGVSSEAVRLGSSVALTIDEGSDAGSGIDAGSLLVERDTAPLHGNSCDPFPDTWTPITLDPDRNDSSAQAATCYRYRATVADNVGNSTASAPALVAGLDQTAPSAPALSLQADSPHTYVAGGTVFYRLAAGSFSIAATSSDPESGLAAVHFPTLPGASGGGSDPSAPYQTSYSWTALPAPWPPTLATVTAANPAGLTAATSFTLSRDDDPPEVALSAERNGASGHIRLSIQATDNGSGIDTRSLVVERDTAPLHGNSCDPFPDTWTPITLDENRNDSSAQAATCYRYRATVADNVGNSTQSAPVVPD